MAERTPKFCSSCGFALQTSFIFCPSCGNHTSVPDSRAVPISGGPSTSSSTAAHVATSSINCDNNISKIPLPNYTEYKKRKESDATSFRKKSTKKSKLQNPVSIQVGIMNKDESLRRGETLPLKVLPSATAEDIRTAALTKHKAFNRKFKSNVQYKLVFRDGSEVKTVPGTNPEQPFSLEKYKEESGFGYARIVLYLLAKESIIDALKRVIKSEDSSSDEDEVVVTATSSGNASNEISPPEKQLTEIHSDSASGSRASVPFITPYEIECPTCFKKFPIQEIANHADICAEGFILEEIPQDIESADELPPFCLEEAEDSSNQCIKTKIESLRAKYIKVEEDPIRITVRRKKVWEDYKRARKMYYTPSRLLKVTFSGEPAVDDGGPRREFFAEMLQYVEHRLFQNGRPQNSTLALSKGDFKIAGEVMAMSILQGGQAPNFLSQIVFNYLSDNLQVTDITSEAHKDLCTKLLNADDGQHGDILMDDRIFPILEEIGYHGVPQRETKQSIANLIRSICMKEQLESVLPQLGHIEEGLNIYGLIDSIKDSKDLWEPVLVPEKGSCVNATMLMDSIVAVYSLSQQKREIEGDVYTYFCDFLHSIDGNSTRIEGICIQDFLQWLTGSRNMPPLGFSHKIKCQFLHDCKEKCQCRPTTSTCDLVITLPVHLENHEHMQKIMISALNDCIGFGLI